MILKIKFLKYKNIEKLDGELKCTRNMHQSLLTFKFSTNMNIDKYIKEKRSKNRALIDTSCYFASVTKMILNLTSLKSVC